ncbi:nuclear distribution protein nudE-like 1 isoform X1 [Dysidea avara]|uniref:nuclear distribution protein nudE-like 1 isoform X1 n=1 Tax=Dysidea avara TaxID=196820 RepID=UPI00332AC9B6
MSEVEVSSFNSVEEELEYWKRKSLEYCESLQETRAEFDEYQESSRELEVELEAQLEQAERRSNELETTLQRLQEENESLRTKLDSQQNEAYVMISRLEEENVELSSTKEQLWKYVRELEQKNDDLERGKRVTMSSLEDFEQKLNQAFERNAILENELDDKEQLQVMCQRLKDEVRDLRQDMNTQTRKPKTGSPETVRSDREVSQVITRHATPSSKSGIIALLLLLYACVAPVVAQKVPPNTPSTSHYQGQAPLTSSTRLSALNMVGDLLRKVGALESRLNTCRTSISKDATRSHLRNPNLSTADTPHIKRPHRDNNIVPANLVKIAV